jgi:hypothetical protein
LEVIEHACINEREGMPVRGSLLLDKNSKASKLNEVFINDLIAATV